MSVFLKTTLLKVLESNLRSTNQIRYYARWSHRQPRRVLTPEEYDKIEEKHQQKSKENVEKPSSLASEKVIELNAEDFIQQNKNHSRSVEKKFNALNTKKVEHVKAVNTKKDEQPQTKIKKSKWIPKSLEPQLGLINMTEVDAKSELIHYKIKSNISKKKTPTYKTKNNIPPTTTDMLETIIDENGEFIYTKLPDNDPSVSQLLVTVKSRGEQFKKDLALLEGKRLIKEALEAKCTLKTLIFSRKNDVEYLKPYLPKSGAKIYKMPYREIQMWSDLTTTPGIMGIFKTPEIETFTPKYSLPLTIICDNIREPGNLGAILRTAAGVGAENVILTKGCVDLWDTKVLRSACGAHFRLQIHKKMDWPDIANRLNTSTTTNTVFIADNKIIRENLQESPELIESSTLRDVIVAMPLLPYYGVNFGDLNHLVLIVGGETEGISEESYRFAANLNGVRLNIPLSNDIDSLNTGTALGVIMFEIKRQMALLQCKNEVIKAEII